jgi:hypothetical protein
MVLVNTAAQVLASRKDGVRSFRVEIWIDEEHLRLLFSGKSLRRELYFLGVLQGWLD